jgi:hypothetical protein
MNGLLRINDTDHRICDGSHSRTGFRNMTKPARLPDPHRQAGAPRPHGWPQYERAERQARLFGAMLDHLGTSQEARRFGLVGIVAASEHCLACRHTVACEAWLTAGGGSFAPSYCPSASVFGRRDVEDPAT